MTWGHLLNNYFPQDISAQPYPQVSKKTGSQPQSERPTLTELELDLTQTSGQTCCGPAPHQSSQCSLPGLEASVRPPTPDCAHALLPGTSSLCKDSLTNAGLPASRGRNSTRAGRAATERKLIVSGPLGSAYNTSGTTVSCWLRAFMLFCVL